MATPCPRGTDPIRFPIRSVTPLDATRPVRGRSALRRLRHDTRLSCTGSLSVSRQKSRTPNHPTHSAVRRQAVQDVAGPAEHRAGQLEALPAVVHVGPPGQALQGRVALVRPALLEPAVAPVRGRPQRPRRVLRGQGELLGEPGRGPVPPQRGEGEGREQLPDGGGQARGAARRPRGRLHQAPVRAPLPPARPREPGPRHRQPVVRRRAHDHGAQVVVPVRLHARARRAHHADLPARPQVQEEVDLGA